MLVVHRLGGLMGLDQAEGNTGLSRKIILGG